MYKYFETFNKRTIIPNQATYHLMDNVARSRCVRSIVSLSHIKTKFNFKSVEDLYINIRLDTIVIQRKHYQSYRQSFQQETLNVSVK